MNPRLLKKGPASFTGPWKQTCLQHESGQITHETFAADSLNLWRHLIDPASPDSRWITWLCVHAHNKQSGHPQVPRRDSPSQHALQDIDARPGSAQGCQLSTRMKLCLLDSTFAIPTGDEKASLQGLDASCTINVPAVLVLGRVQPEHRLPSSAMPCRHSIQVCMERDHSAGVDGL